MSQKEQMELGSAVSAPSLAKLRFLPSVQEPEELWKKCVKTQEDWDKQLSRVEEKVERMKEYEKKKAVELVWLTNALEDTLPKGLSKQRADEILTQAYDTVLQQIEDPGLCQLTHHLKAFKYLCKGSDSLPELTEDMIKQTHKIMMQGLKNEQGLDVDPGAYRTGPVCAGFHTYPSHDCIPTAMARIMKEYNEKFSQSHDQYQLASWLFFEVVTLHPFLDGNGRISRLLWCYSLMRDGQPFPTVLTSGHKESQSHLVLCLKRDGDFFVSNNPHLTTHTIVSVNQAWDDYFKMLT